MSILLYPPTISQPYLKWLQILIPLPKVISIIITITSFIFIIIDIYYIILYQTQYMIPYTKDEQQLLQVAWFKNWTDILQFQSKGEKITMMLQLNLKKCNLTAIPKCLKCLTNLQRLTLMANKIMKIENIQYFQNLISLNLSQNQINKIQNLSNCSSLKDLNLWNNQISLIQGLEQLNSLQILNIGTNKLLNIKNVQNLINICTLDLRCNQILNIQFINNGFDETLKQFMPYSQITRPFQNSLNLQSLQELFLSTNQITSIEKLLYIKMPNLNQLWLDYNHISNVRVLRRINAEEIQNLLLYDNKISELSSLKQMKNRNLNSILYDQDSLIKGRNQFLLEMESNQQQIAKASIMQNIKNFLFGKKLTQLQLNNDNSKIKTISLQQNNSIINNQIILSMHLISNFNNSIQLYMPMYPYYIIQYNFYSYLLMQLQASITKKESSQTKTSNTIFQILRQSNHQQQLIDYEIGTQERQQIEQYNEYMKDVQPMMTTSEAILRLQAHQISYDNTVQQFVDFEIVQMYQTRNGQACSLKMKVGSFKTIINVLNVSERSLMHSCQQIGHGSFGNVYEFKFDKQMGICKCIKYKELVATYSKSKADIENQISIVIRQVLKQVCFAKIFSLLQIGPFFPSYFGFDLIFYHDCVQFTMENCSQPTPELGNHYKDLKQSLKIMHSLGIAHRDIKDKNIVYSHYFQKYVFCDFGTVISLKEKIGQRSLSQRVGSEAFMSPRMLKLDKVNKQFVNLYHNDIYGLKLTCKNLNAPSIVIERESCFKVQMQPYYLILLKYWMLVQKFDKIVNQFRKDNPNYKIHKYKLLQFVVEITPNQKMRQFFIQNYQMSETNPTLYNIYGQKNILSYSVPEHKQKKKQNSLKIQRFKRLMKSSTNYQSETLMSKIIIRKLIINQEICNIQIQILCSTFILHMANPNFPLTDKVKISQSFYRNFIATRIYDDFLQCQSKAPLVFRALSMASYFIIHKMNDKLQKQILLKRLIEIYSDEFFSFPGYIICLEQFSKISNNLICLLSFAFLLKNCSYQLIEEVMSENIFDKVLKSESQYESSIAQAIIRFTKLFKQWLQNVNKISPQIMQNEVKNIIGLINRRIQINEHLQLIIIISYVHLLQFYKIQGFYHSALRVCDYVISQFKFKNFKKIFLMLTRKSLTEIYASILGDKNKIKSLYKCIQINMQNKNHFVYLERYRKGLISLYQRNLSQYQLYKPLIYKNNDQCQNQFYILLRKCYHQRDLLPKYRSNNIKKLEIAFYKYLNQKEVPIKILRTSAIYILDFYLESCQFLQNSNKFEKMVGDLRQLIGNLRFYYYNGRLEMNKKSFKSAFNWFIQAQEYFIKSFDGRQCFLHAVISFQANLHGNQDKILFSRQKITQLLAIYFKRYRQLELFMLDTKQIYCFQLYMELCIINQNYQQYFQELKWQANINSKYDSIILYHPYSIAVKKIQKGSTQFCLQILRMTMESRFDQTQSQIKELTFLAGVIINKIYRKLNFQEINGMIYRIFRTFSFISKQTVLQIMNNLYKTISHCQKNKRKKRHLMKKHYKMSQIAISKHKFIKSYKMRGKEIPENLSNKIHEMAIKIPRLFINQ